MSIHAKRAATVVVVLAIFTVVRIARGVSMVGPGGIGALSFGLTEALTSFVVSALLIGCIVYWFSKRSSGGPTGRR